MHHSICSTFLARHRGVHQLLYNAGHGRQDMKSVAMKPGLQAPAAQAVVPTWTDMHMTTVATAEPKLRTVNT